MYRMCHKYCFNNFVFYFSSSAIPHHSVGVARRQSQERCYSNRKLPPPSPQSGYARTSSSWSLGRLAYAPKGIIFNRTFIKDFKLNVMNPMIKKNNWSVLNIERLLTPSWIALLVKTPRAERSIILLTWFLRVFYSIQGESIQKKS